LKPEKLLLELEQLLEQTGYRIRRERGAFRGNSCLVEGDKIVVINKNKPMELQVGTLARILKEMDLDDFFIKPAVRKELSALWKKIDTKSTGLESIEIEDFS